MLREERSGGARGGAGVRGGQKRVRDEGGRDRRGCEMPQAMLAAAGTGRTGRHSDEQVQTVPCL